MFEVSAKRTEPPRGFQSETSLPCGLFSLRRYGQNEGEGGAPADPLRIDPDPASVGFDDTLNQCQTDPAALGLRVDLLDCRRSPARGPVAAIQGLR